MAEVVPPSWISLPALMCVCATLALTDVTPSLITVEQVSGLGTPPCSGPGLRCNQFTAFTPGLELARTSETFWSPPEFSAGDTDPTPLSSSHT